MKWELTIEEARRRLERAKDDLQDKIRAVDSCQWAYNRSRCEELDQHDFAPRHDAKVTGMGPQCIYCHKPAPKEWGNELVDCGMGMVKKFIRYDEPPSIP